MLWSLQPMGFDTALDQSSAVLIHIISIQVDVTDPTLLVYALGGVG
jgi:hypothetical protein